MHIKLKPSNISIISGCDITYNRPTHKFGFGTQSHAVSSHIHSNSVQSLYIIVGPKG